MANNVNIPATGVGDPTPRISTDQITADSSQVQNCQLGSMSAGVLTRFTAGQKTMATSFPVCISSDQGVIPVKGDQARGSAAPPNPIMQGLRASAYPTKPASVAAGQFVDATADLEGVPYVRQRVLNTFVSVFRLALAAASSGLAFTFTANTDKQLATIFHAAGSTKLCRITYCAVEIVAIGAVAGQLQFELRRLTSATTPATGNPAITPVNRNPGGAAVDAVTLALPTTVGTDFAANSPIQSRILPVIASQAPIVSTWPAIPSTVVLYDDKGYDEEEQPTMRPGNAEGYAIVGRSTAAIPLTFTAIIAFTEE